MSATRLRPLALWPCNKLHDVVFGDLHLLQRANRLAVTQYRGAVGDSTSSAILCVTMKIAHPSLVRERILAKSRSVAS